MSGCCSHAMGFCNLLHLCKLVAKLTGLEKLRNYQVSLLIKLGKITSLISDIFKNLLLGYLYSCSGMWVDWIDRQQLPLFPVREETQQKRVGRLILVKNNNQCYNTY